MGKEQATPVEICDDSRREAELITCNNIDRSSLADETVDDSAQPSDAVASNATTSTVQTKTEGTVEDCNEREKLKRHRIDVAGRVWVPDTWGQESLLKDLSDCAAFDSSLGSSTNIMLARASLIQQGRRFKIENRC